MKNRIKNKVALSYWTGALSIWLNIGNEWIWEKSFLYSDLSILFWITSQIIGYTCMEYIRAGEG